MNKHFSLAIVRSLFVWDIMKVYFLKSVRSYSPSPYMKNVFFIHAFKNKTLFPPRASQNFPLYPDLNGRKYSRESNSHTYFAHPLKYTWLISSDNALNYVLWFVEKFYSNVNTRMRVILHMYENMYIHTLEHYRVRLPSLSTREFIYHNVT